MLKPDAKIIYVTSGTGTGQTNLAAFDSALLQAQIANFNLITLSSIIPPGRKIVSQRTKIQSDELFGSKLYVVLSQKREHEIGREAWAGLGWVQQEDGKGLFVEQYGTQKAEVIRLIKETLNDMVASRSGEYGEIQWHVVGTRCEHQPVCALVAAVYEVEPWRT